MADNLRLLAKYSAAMNSGDTDAVFEFWSEDFHSHVTKRVSPERVGRTFVERSGFGGPSPISFPGHGLHRRPRD